MRTLTVFFGFVAFVSTLLFEEGLYRLPGLGGWLEARGSRRGPEVLVKLLERLGGTFVKFGQLLSMRSDILPHHYCLALGDLFDKVPPFEVSIARQVIEEELGDKVEVLFEAFDPEPLAAASFGQVHRVVLGQGPDQGTEAVIKIQRPHIRDQLKGDTRLLLAIGWCLDASNLLGQIKLLPVFKDFARWTGRELNFTQEAKNADRLFEETEWNFKQRIPYVYWDYTTPRLLTMEYLKGLPVSAILQRFEEGDLTLDDELKAMGCDRVQLARHIYQNFYLQAFIGHVFHADPHPGNLFVLPDNVIGYVDFGLLGRMSRESLDEQMAVLEAVARSDMERLFVAILDVIDAPRGLLVTESFEAFVEAADAWLDACDNPGATLGEKSINNFVVATMDLAKSVGIPLSMNTTLYYKALMSVDASVLRLAPEMDYNTETQQALRLVKLRELEEYLAPGAALDRSLHVLMLLMKAPDFITEQLINYQQSTRRMYRKFNQVPLVLSHAVRWLAWCSMGLGAVLWLDLKYASHLPPLLTQSPWFHTVREIGHLWPGFVLATFLLLWLARVIKGQALVKVQRSSTEA